MESQKASKRTIGMTMTTQGRFVAPFTLRLQRILNTKMHIQDKPDENGVVLLKKNVGKNVLKFTMLKMKISYKPTCKSEYL